MHVWDLFADLVIPTLSFGFDTLTSNPVAGSSSPVDGIVKQNYSAGSGVSWATIIADAGNGFDNACATWGFGHDTVFFIKGDNVSNKWIQLERSIFCFDTSALTASAVISAATLSLFGNDKADGLGSTPNANIYGATPASTSTLANGDYTQVGSTAFSTAISYSSLSTTAYNDFVLNASGLANISLTGISKFGGRNANYDVAAITPTWVSNQFSYFICSHADRTGTNEDPKLLVTYSLPAPPASVESVASVAFQIKDQVTAY